MDAVTAIVVMLGKVSERTDNGGSAGRVVIVDDHPLLAIGLKDQLERRCISVDVVDPTVATNLVDDIVGRAADMILVDLDLPYDDGGVGLTRHLVEVGQNVAVLTGSTNRIRWAQCLERGASALLTKDQPLDGLIGDIKKVLDGEPVRPHQQLELMNEYREWAANRAAKSQGFEELSEREGQVLAGLMAGLSPSSLAERDFVSVQTVRTQIKSVLSKLGVNSQLAAVARAHESGWRPDARGL